MFGQFPTFHFGLAHSGSQPFIYIAAYAELINVHLNHGLASSGILCVDGRQNVSLVSLFSAHVLLYMSKHVFHSSQHKLHLNTNTYIHGKYVYSTVA